MTNARKSGVPFTVRLYRPTDEDGILRVIQASFPQWPAIETSVTDIDHLRWKLAGVRDAESNHIVVEADGRIIGVRLSWLRIVKCCGETRLARTDSDNSVLPEWRGRGVNGAIIRLGVETSPADMVVTTTGNETIRRADAGLGHLEFRNRMFQVTAHLSDERFAPRPQTAVSEVKRLDDRTASFWHSASAQFDFIALPSVDLLNWRYCDPRSGRGFVLQSEENGGINGILISRITRGRGTIAYLLAMPGRNEVISDLIAAAHARLLSLGAIDVSCALPERHPYRQVLQEFGYSGRGHRIPLTARPRVGDPDLPFLHKNAAVHWMLGDTDLV